MTRYGIAHAKIEYDRALVKAHRMYRDRAIRRVYLEHDEIANTICLSELLQHRDVEILVLCPSSRWIAIAGERDPPPYSALVALAEMPRTVQPTTARVASDHMRASLHREAEERGAWSRSKHPSS